MKNRLAKDNLQPAHIYSFLGREHLPIFILYYLATHLITNKAAPNFIDGETLAERAGVLKMAAEAP